MDIDELKTEAYRESGCLEGTDDGYRCRLCGGVGPDMLNVDHAADCELYAIVESMGIGGQDGQVGAGATGLSQNLRLEITSHVTLQQISEIDAFVDRMAGSQDLAERVKLAHEIEERFPAADRETLLGYALAGMFDNDRLDAFRTYLMFEAGIGSERSGLQAELSALQREIDGAKRLEDALRTSIDSGRARLNDR